MNTKLIPLIIYINKKIILFNECKQLTFHIVFCIYIYIYVYISLQKYVCHQQFGKMVLLPKLKRIVFKFYKNMGHIFKELDSCKYLVSAPE